MAQPPAPPPDPEPTAFLEPVVRPIVKATDLGSVQVLKQGNLYLLTDPFGDVHPDTRGLGLYEGDTRRLSCAILRINGARPVLLQASAGGNCRGHDPADQPADRAQPARTRCQPGGGARDPEAGHRPDADADRHAARGAGPGRQLRGGAATTWSSSWSSRPTRRTSSRSAGGAAASAARQLPVALRPRPGDVPLRRPGRGPDEHPPRVLASPRADAGPGRSRTLPAPRTRAGSGCPGAGRWPAGEARELALGLRGPHGAARSPPMAAAGTDGAGRRTCSPRAVPPRGRATRRRRLAYRDVEPGLRRDPAPTTSCSTSPSAVGRRPAAAPERRPGHGRALHRRGRARGSPRCSGATPSSRRSRRSPFVPAIARRDARGPGRIPGDRGRPGAGHGARQDPPRAPHRRDGAHRRAAAPPVLRDASTRRRCG